MKLVWVRLLLDDLTFIQCDSCSRNGWVDDNQQMECQCRMYPTPSKLIVNGNQVWHFVSYHYQKHLNKSYSLLQNIDKVMATLNKGNVSNLKFFLSGSMDKATSKNAIKSLA